MKRTYIIATLLLILAFSACKESEFADSYPDPSKIKTTSVEKQFSGFMQSNLGLVMPSYWNYFVTNRITLSRYTQSVGWVNTTDQYVPGSAAVGDRWSAYYSFLAQYREFQNVYNKLVITDGDKLNYRIFMIAATIYFYDHTQKVVDLHGDIPWSAAGKMGENGGDYTISYPAYDDQVVIYTKMLDDLKAFSEELTTITVPTAILNVFKTQDFLNKGDVSLWKKYCNSLRLKMLTRVSASSALKDRASTEIGQILGSSTKYPVISVNSENIQVNVFDINTNINSKGFRSGLEDWNGNIANKVMIDYMLKNTDPRLKVMFESNPLGTAGVYKGLDQLAEPAVQDEQINRSNSISIYNRSTISRNQFFPGVIMNAAEVNYLIAEYYLLKGQDALAKAAYENGIKASIEYYYNIRAISNDNISPNVTAPTAAEVSTYLASSGVKWENATTQTAKLNLIATQKWIHFNVIQPEENWAELRRLDLPSLTFWTDNASAKQKTVPFRWQMPGSESTYNTENYSKVQSKDLLTNKIFWDVK